MYGFIKKIFVAVMTFVFCDALKCVSMINQECKVRTGMANINSNEPFFYPYSVFVNKCIGSSNDINNPYAELCFQLLLKLFC